MAKSPLTKAKFGKFFGRTLSEATGYAVGGAVGDTLKPVLQDLTNETWDAHPVLPLPAAIAAEASAKLIWGTDAANAEGNLTGTNNARMAILRRLAVTPPQLAVLLDLWRRGAIDEPSFEAGYHRLGFDSQWLADVKELRAVLPSAEDLAAMVVQGVLTHEQAVGLAAKVGASAETFDRYYRVAGEPIAPEQALDLWNRGDLAEGDVDRALRQGRLKPEWVDDVKRLRHVLAPVSDLVRFAVREVFDPESRRALDLDAELPAAFVKAAARVGLDAEQAANYWAAHWGLPSYEQAAQMLFRGELTEPQFAELLKALDYAPTWRGKLANIARAIPTLTDSIRFAVREVYDPASRARLQLDADYPAIFTEKAAMHGLSEEDAQDYWAAHWQLPSRLEGATMLHRGLITDAEYAQLLKALDFSPTWRENLEAIARLVPGRIDLRRFYTAGIIDRAETKAGYVRLGYSDQDAERLTSLASTGAGAKSKDLTATQLAAEYLGRHIDRAEYVRELDALGYSTEEAERLAALADRKRIDRAREQFISRIHSVFVGHRLTDAQARAALAEGGITPAAIDALMVEWTHEQAINLHPLTEAQVVKAYKKASLSRAQALDRLEDLGVPTNDANIRLDDA